MGAKPQRICVNCKHHRKIFDRNKCYLKAETQQSEPDPVSGRTYVYASGVKVCSDERRWQGPHCGPDARFYEEKRLTKRLIAWFKS